MEVRANDGYRLLVRIDGDQVQLFTKNGFDWTDRMPRLAKDLKGANRENGNFRTLSALSVRLRS